MSFSNSSQLRRRNHTTSSSLAFNAPALVTGGLIGCAAGAAILMAVHVWYDFAGVKAAIATARAARIRERGRWVVLPNELKTKEGPSKSSRP